MGIEVLTDNAVSDSAGLEKETFEEQGNESETAQKTIYMHIEPGMVFYVCGITFSTHGIFSGKFVARTSIIPSSQVNEKRRLKKRIKAELRKLDKEFPKPGKPPEYKMGLEKFDPENNIDTKMMIELKKYQYWLKNDLRVRKWNSEARRWRILWDENYRKRIDPLFRQYYRNMGNNGRELIVVFDPIVDPVTLKSKSRRDISPDSFLTPDRLPDKIDLYLFDNNRYRGVKVRCN